MLINVKRPRQYLKQLQWYNLRCEQCCHDVFLIAFAWITSVSYNTYFGIFLWVRSRFETSSLRDVLTGNWRVDRLRQVRFLCWRGFVLPCRWRFMLQPDRDCESAPTALQPFKRYILYKVSNCWRFVCFQQLLLHPMLRLPLSTLSRQKSANAVTHFFRSSSWLPVRLPRGLCGWL